MPDEIAKTCGTCRHWDTGFSTPPYGECMRIGLETETNDLAYLNTGEHGADLQTRPEFFCALWEAKESA